MIAPYLRQFAASLLLCIACTAAGAIERPNIIVILSDDMGYSDAGCFGGEIHTPNLDKLADGGLRFTEFYNSARCWPTRATLMSGRYEGISLVPILDGKAVPRDRAYYFKRGSKSRALISGDYKIVRDGDDPRALYNLSQDFSETDDLASQYPELVSKRAQQWQSQKWKHPRILNPLPKTPAQRQ